MKIGECILKGLKTQFTLAMNCEPCTEEMEYLYSPRLGNFENATELCV